MRLSGLIAGPVGLFLAVAAPVFAQTPAPVPVPVQQARVDDPGHAAIPVAIWSPPGEPAGRPLPLVVISHGTGAALTSHVDTAQALARAGFVVVALMHPGDNYQDDSIVGRPQWFADRSRHVGRVIDFMYGSWEGRARLRPNRVGIFGFSAGATTALIAIGGEPDLGRVTSHCAQHAEFACTLMRPAAPGAASSPPQWVHDPRIAAAVVAAPGIGFAFEPSGLAHVRVPVQLWSGAADQTVPYATNTAVVQRLLGRRAEPHSVPGAVHLSFLAPCPGGPPAFCQDPPGFDRAVFHRTFNQAVADFFRRTLVAR